MNIYCKRIHRPSFSVSQRKLRQHDHSRKYKNDLQYGSRFLIIYIYFTTILTSLVGSNSSVNCWRLEIDKQTRQSLFGNDIDEFGWLQQSENRLLKVGNEQINWLLHYNINQFIWYTNHLHHCLPSDFSLDFFVCKGNFFKFIWC